MLYMHAVQLRGIDLNLLVVLDALLATGSVKRAARELALSASATSHALARLRELLGDPILVRAGRGLVPTARGEALRGELRRIMEELQRVLGEGAAFDPAALRRTFVLSTTDYAELYPMRDASALIAERAPGVELRLIHQTGDRVAELRSGAVDLVLGIAATGADDVRSEPLFTERFTLALRRGHPALRRKLTIERFAALDHVLVAPRGLPGSMVDSVLADHGLSRRVARTVSSFAAAPHMIADTDYVATLPERIARYFAPLLDLVLRDPPVALPGFTMAQSWHRRHDADPAHAWLRARLAEVSARLG